MFAWKKIYTVNLFFWVCYFPYEWLANAAYDDAYQKNFVQACLYTSVTFLAARIILLMVTHTLFVPQRRWWAWPLLSASAVGFILLRRVFSYYVMSKTYDPKNYASTHYWSIKLIYEGTWMCLVVGFSIMLYFMQAWYEQQRISETLKKDKAVAQLELLKSQVHPHFIFNTLNNLYSLSLHQDPRTPDLIHRLSSLLSYMLYESKDAMIPMAKEVEYVLNYVELQKIRYSDRLDVSINIFGTLEKFYVTPLILLPLIENCFKHGVSNEAEHCWIRMDLSRSEDWVIVKFENSRSVNGHALVDTGGIGLANVRRRLEILYPEQHELKTLSEDQSFLAVLKIKNQVYENNLSDSR
jgi:hypothetical protein